MDEIEIDAQQVARATAALDRVKRRWLRRPGVAAVDVGFPITDGDLRTGEIALRVHVERKVPRAALPDHEVFNVSARERDGGAPTLIDDEFPVDVIEAAYEPTTEPVEPEEPEEPTPEGAADAERRDRYSTLLGGLSIGTAFSTGTLGAVVWDRRDGTPHLLSNWHVLRGVARGATSPAADGLTGAEPHYHALSGLEPHYHALSGLEPHYHALSGLEPHYHALDPGGCPVCAAARAVYQPAPHDGGVATDQVAVVTRGRLDERMDAGVARLTGARPYAADVLGLGPLRGHTAPRLGMLVRKSGRTTKVTEGIVDGVALTTTITYPQGRQTFHGQIHIVPRHPWPAAGGAEETSEPGDSGACWVQDGTDLAVGLHFGGDLLGTPQSEHSLATPMPVVVDALEISFTPPVETVEPTAPPQAPGTPAPEDSLLALAAAALAAADSDGQRRDRRLLEGLRGVIDATLDRLP